MKKKQSITQKVLDDIGLESPRRFKKKKKKSPYPPPEYTQRDLTDVYDALKKMLKKHAKRFEVTEEENSYYLRVKARGEFKAFSLFGVSINSGYVAFHHFALVDKNYDKKWFPAKLRPRRHGQGTLNFVEIDRPLFKILEKEIANVIKAAENSGYFGD